MDKVYYIASPSTDPHWNLALEEYVFEQMDRQWAYFMLWQNENTVVVGKNQNTVEQVNGPYVASHGVNVVRRCSGGGAVYHDLGNLNFTFIMDAPKLEELNFHLFCQPVIATLAQYGVEAQVTGRNDMTIGGKKFSGNAQYIKNSRVMHHGTLMFDSDLSVLEEVLCVSGDKIQSKGIQSVRSRVTNVKAHLKSPSTLAQFQAQLVNQVGENCQLEALTLTPGQMAAVTALAEGKYRTWDWNYGGSPKYQINKKRRIEGCGLVEVSMAVEGGSIGEISISGDFFGSGDLQELCSHLQGCQCQEQAVIHRLQTLDISWYVHQLTAVTLAELIVC